MSHKYMITVTRGRLQGRAVHNSALSVSTMEVRQECLHISTFDIRYLIFNNVQVGKECLDMVNEHRLWQDLLPIDSDTASSRKVCP